jgi:hypothetical protein
MGIVQMELDTGSFEWKKYLHVPRYVYRGSSVLPKCSGKRIRTGEMHDSCHGQPDTLTGKSHLCQTDHDWSECIYLIPQL